MKNVIVSFLKGILVGLFILIVLYFLWQERLEAVAILVGVGGWLFSAWRDRVLQEEQFVMNKKFRAYELLQRRLTIYTKKLNKALDEIVRKKFSLNSEIMRDYVDWEKVQVEILDVWLKASLAWVGFHRTFENYRIALAEIEELFFKLLDKHKGFEAYIHSRIIDNIEDYSDVGENVEKRIKLNKLLDELTVKIMEQLTFNLDAVTGFQNRLFSGVFKRRVPKRKPVNKKYEVLE